MIKSEKLASKLLDELISNHISSDTINFQQICDSLSDKGFALLMILFAIPLSIPIPIVIPGFTAILGTPLLYLSFQVLKGDLKPSLPTWIASKTIKTSNLKVFIHSFNQYLMKLEHIFKPRIIFLSSPKGEKIIGFISLLCSISIVLPIAFGNLVPSIGILIMFLGLLAKDGIIILFGMIISIIGLIIASFVVFLFFYGVKMTTDGSLFKLIYS